MLLKLVKTIKKEKQTALINQTVRQIINSLDGLIISLDPKHNTVLANHAFLKYVGFKNLKELYEAKYDFFANIQKEDGFLYATNIKELCDAMQCDCAQAKIKLLGKQNQLQTFSVKLIETGKDIVICLNQISELEDKIKKLEKLSVYDSLTKTYNKAKIDNAAKKEIEQVKRFGSSCCLIRFDIDHLGAINELYGVDCGDKAIIHACEITSSLLSADEILARESQDEFLILCPKLTLADAFFLAENIKSKLEQTNFEDTGAVTCSFGVVCYDPLRGGYQDLLSDSAKALKLAKVNRNCVRTLDNLEHIVKEELHSKAIKEIISEFDDLRRKKTQITLCAFYKGLVVSQNAVINDVCKNTKSISVSLPQKKVALFNKIGSAYLKYDEQTKAIHCSVAGVSTNGAYLELNNFMPPTNSPTDRKLLRLETQKVVDIALVFKDEEFVATMLDISTESLRVKISKMPNIPVGASLSVSFEVVGEKKFYKVFGQAKIIKSYYDSDLDNYILILNFNADNKCKKELVSYLSDRQMEIIREINEI